MNIYIELGAANGKKSKNKIIEHPDTVVYAFECSPWPKRRLTKMSERYGERFHYIPKAAWIENKKNVIFNMGKQIQNSSLYKKGRQSGDTVLVDCIDFPQWLKDNCNKDDQVELDIDIEGAEYEILNNMIDTGSISLINTLVVEFHIYKIRKALPREEFVRLAKMHNKIIRYLDEHPSIKTKLFRVNGLVGNI